MQYKNVHFNSSAFSIAFLAFSFNVLMMFSSCSPNSNLQGEGIKMLQGEWQQDADTAVYKKLVNYTLYNFKFSCDSFYVVMESHSKTNYGADSCMKNGSWKEYAQGVYYQQRDTIYLKGFFCEADYKLKIEGGCFRTGVYEDAFIFKAKADSGIEMMSTSSVLPLYLRLIKRTGCMPKPLY